MDFTSPLLRALHSQSTSPILPWICVAPKLTYDVTIVQPLCSATALHSSAFIAPGFSRFLPFLPVSRSLFYFFSSRKAKRGKGHKRKRKKIRYKSHRFHCEPCTDTERRKHLFVQDPQTCKCSCKNTDSRCKTKQLELNERTCRCEKPRR